jgi:hypothetical protein
MAARRKITEKRAASAARQLLYHQRLSEWISQKMASFSAILESYLVGSGEDSAVLLGGYVVERAGEDLACPVVEVSEPLAGPDYEQLALQEAC